MAEGCRLRPACGVHGGLSRLEIGFPILGVDLSLTLGTTQLKTAGCFFWFFAREPVAWPDAELLCGSSNKSMNYQL